MVGRTHVGVDWESMLNGQSHKVFRFGDSLRHAETLGQPGRNRRSIGSAGTMRILGIDFLRFKRSIVLTVIQQVNRIIRTQFGAALDQHILGS